jgi:hypothetical protein
LRIDVDSETLDILTVSTDMSVDGEEPFPRDTQSVEAPKLDSADIQVGSSGFHVLCAGEHGGARARQGRGLHQLLLYTFHPSTETWTIHDLQQPPPENKYTLQQATVMDDHLGIIVLRNSFNGSTYVLSYL